MGIQQVLRMNEGDRKSSYAHNSSLQKAQILKTRPLIQESVQAIISSSNPSRLSIADLGCATGPNALLPTAIILDVVAHDSCRRRGSSCVEFQAFLNDLPGNDFNAIFRGIPSFYSKLAEDEGEEFARSCFLAAAPGSFYGRLFPSDSLHFVYCANSLMWRSQVPPELEGPTNGLNRGNIALGRTSPPKVFEAYLSQFGRDLISFLGSRATELAAGGRMVLQLAGRESADPFAEECSYVWDDLAHAMRDLVQEGVVEEEEMSSFNLPFYAPHIDELKEVIHGEGSFDIIRCEETPWDAAAAFGADAVRAVAEPLLEDRFGKEVMDELFMKLRDHLPREGIHGLVCVVASLARK